MKIALTIAGLLSLAGIVYAANPTPFTTFNTPVGVAASGTAPIVTEYCGHNVDTLDCQGNVTLPIHSSLEIAPETIHPQKNSAGSVNAPGAFSFKISSQEQMSS